MITKQNGGKYESRWSGAEWKDKELRFFDAYVVVSKDSGLKDTKIFLDATYAETSGPVRHIVCVTVKADTSKIYDAWSDLVD